MMQRYAAIGFIAWALAGCAPDPLTAEELGTSAGELGFIEPVGTPAAFDVGTWNIQWFGSTESGPSPEWRQLHNAAHVLRWTAMDLWILTEISDAAAFEALLAELPGYAGFLASDASVHDGAASYAPGEQAVAVVYDPDVVEVIDASVVLAEASYDFAGRPPLAFDARVTLAGTTTDVVVLGVHLKAMVDQQSWWRRFNASRALEAHVEERYAGLPVIIAGDWNDDVDGSTVWGKPSPFENFSGHSEYAFVTAALSESGAATRCVGEAFLDHVLVSDERLPSWDGAQVFAAADVVPEFCASTSDHYPVLASFSLDASTP